MTAAAIEALGGDVSEKQQETKDPTSPKLSYLASFFGVRNTQPMKGITTPVCSTLRK